MKKSVALFGGDMRHNYLAKEFFDSGYDVYTFAQDDGTFKFSSLHNDEKIDIYILPMPISLDGVHLNCSLTEKNYKLDEICTMLDNEKLILGGSIREKSKEIFDKNKIDIIDFLNREELAVLNAIPTAEGAIEVAFKSMLITLHDSNALVLGNGRIGKILSKKLNLLGANTTVSARKSKDFADISSNNLNSVHLCDINYQNYDVIFNTIPHLVLDKTALEKINRNTVIIDLASKPGGVDFEFAKKIGVTAIMASSLPGKVAPITSAKYIFKTITNIIYETEVE